jgi:hypothetical protein
MVSSETVGNPTLHGIFKNSWKADIAWYLQKQLKADISWYPQKQLESRHCMVSSETAAK